MGKIDEYEYYRWVNVNNHQQMEKVDKYVNKYIDCELESISDILGLDNPSKYFFRMVKKYGHLLNDDPSISVNRKDQIRRKVAYKKTKKQIQNSLANIQIIEDRNTLDSSRHYDEISLPKEPVIWMSNYTFSNETINTALTYNRHPYILYSNLPQFFNTKNGDIIEKIGVILINRKIETSKKSSVDRALRAIDIGKDIIIFPEGVLNKSPEKLFLPFWPEINQIALKSGSQIIPVIHYIKDDTIPSKNNPIHTVIDDPISLPIIINGKELNEEETLLYLRDIMATWYYRLMEKYGKSTREQEIGNSTFNKAWESKIKKRINNITYYDESIETKADYQPEDIVNPEEVFSSIANLIPEENLMYEEDITDIIKMPNEEYIRKLTDGNIAKKLVKERSSQQFQRKF